MDGNHSYGIILAIEYQAMTISMFKRIQVVEQILETLVSQVFF